LPAPDAPTSATTSPGATCRWTSVSTGWPRRLGYANETPSSETAPLPGGSGVVTSRSRISGTVSITANSRSVEPAARCSAPHSPATSASAPATMNVYRKNDVSSPPVSSLLMSARPPSQITAATPM